MKSIRISDDAYGLVQDEATLMNRSIAQQLEHWVRLGRSLEASGLTVPQVKELLQGAPTGRASPALPASVQRAIEFIAGTLSPAAIAEAGRALRREVSALLQKHSAMQYGELAALEPSRRQQLAREVQTAEMRERRNP